MDDLQAFTDAGRRLREVDPDAFRRMLAACRALVALHDRELEDDALWSSRMMEISSDTPIGQA